MRVGEQAIVDLAGLDVLIRTLAEHGYETQGPVARDGAIMPGAVARASDLPAGFHDEQAPGHYRLRHDGDEAVFGWAVGPGSWKAELFPPQQELWRTSRREGEVTFREPTPEAAAPLAVIGARPCELAALSILDRVLQGGAAPDPRYQRRREGDVRGGGGVRHAIGHLFLHLDGHRSGGDRRVRPGSAGAGTASSARTCCVATGPCCHTGVRFPISSRSGSDEWRPSQSGCLEVRLL
jgi:hypothetical protein